MSDKPSASVRSYARVVLLVLVAVMTAVLIVRNFDVSRNVLLVLLGFGAVVLVHEFGHFVVAKLCGIKVEAFSIFMPPILLGIKKADRGYRIRILPELLRKEGNQREEGLLTFHVGKKILPGETEYRIGLIPFGGFVKMLGQDDVGADKPSDDPRSFANKPAWVRAAVFASGVTFNVISAVIIFMIVFMVGINLVAPVVGGVMPGSPAERAGIEAGDEVIEVSGKDGRLDFSDIMMAAVLSGEGKEVPLKIRRSDGTIKDVKLVAEKLPGEKFRGFGIEGPMSLTIEQLVPGDANRLFTETGLLPGDRIRSVGGVDVNSYWQMQKVIEGTFAADVAVLAERRQSSGKLELVETRLSLHPVAATDPNVQTEADLANICTIVPRLRITGVVGKPVSFKERLLGLLSRVGLGGAKVDDTPRLKAGDIIVAVADVEKPTYLELRQLTNEYEDKELPVTVLRSDSNGVGQRVTVPVVPEKLPDSERVVIGIEVELDAEEPIVAKTIATKQYPKPLDIPSGARITAVDGVEVSSFYDVASQLQANAGQRVTIDWRLNEQVAGNVAVDVGEEKGIVKVHSFLEQIVPFARLERLYKGKGPVDAIMMGYKRTKIFIIQTYVTLQRLIGGVVSPKQLMGPVGILTVSYRIVATQPFVYYVYFIGLISACIAVFNFLPLPPLDGGLVLLLLVEKIKGSALSIRTQEIIAYTGWGLIIALFIYVTFNDVVRSFFG